MKPTLTTERVQAALRREGTATTSTIAAGLGERASGVHRMLRTGVVDGWCRVVGKDGKADVYAWAVIDPAPPIEMRSDEQFERENAERSRRRRGGPVCAVCNDTHIMPTSEEEIDRLGAPRKWPCTSCPVPCDRCRVRQAAYCAMTPCGCSCHARKR